MARERTKVVVDERRERILARLSEISERQAKDAMLQSEKTELLRIARGMSPPMTWRELAEALGVSEQAALQLLRRSS